MVRKTLCALGFALTVAALPGGPALADSFELMTQDGPLHLHISRDGDVRGEYPKLQGVIRGRVGANGSIYGMWYQPRSDHPCASMRGDTFAWGAFSITSPYRSYVSGTWGYCDEQPNRDWGVERG